MCTGAKFWHAYKSSTVTSQEEKDELDHKLYMICDRVACTASPKECGSARDLSQDNSDKLSKILNGKGEGSLTVGDGLDPANANILDSDDQYVRRGRP